MTQNLEQIIAATVKATLDASPPQRIGYTVRDAALAVGLAPHVIQDAISRGELAARKRGRYWMIRRDYLERWLAARE